MHRHAGLPRAFDLSRVGYFLDFVLVPSAAFALHMFSVWRDIGPLGLAIGTAAGVLAWSLAEYWIHRLVFHGPASPFEPMHQMHHALPKDMIGIASWGTFIGFAGVWLVAQVFLGPALGSAVTAGFLLGYLFYCSIHVAIHHRGARGFGRYGALMLRLHQAHHRGGQKSKVVNFGVTSPLWDFVFRTFQPIK